MRISLAIIAEKIDRRDDGRINIIGIYGGLKCDEYPTTLRQVAMLLRLDADSQTKRGSEHFILIRQHDESRNEIDRIGPIKATVDTEGAHQPIITDIKVPKPGRYSFDIEVDGHEMASIPLHIYTTEEWSARMKADGIMPVE